MCCEIVISSYRLKAAGGYKYKNCIFFDMLVGEYGPILS